MFSSFLPSLFSSKLKPSSTNYTFENFTKNSSKISTDVLRIYPKGEWTTQYIEDHKLSPVFINEGKLDHHEILEEATQLVYELFHMVYCDPIRNALKLVDSKQYSLHLEFEFELIKYWFSNDKDYVVDSSNDTFRFRSNLSSRRASHTKRSFTEWFSVEGITPSTNDVVDKFLVGLLQDVENFVQTCSVSQQYGYLLGAPLKMDIQFVKLTDNNDMTTNSSAKSKVGMKHGFQEPILLEYSKGAIPVLTPGSPNVLTETSNEVVRTPNLEVQFCEINLYLSQSLLDASSHLFYVVEGCGYTRLSGENPSDDLSFLWEEGDVFVLPCCKNVFHHSLSKTKSRFLCVSDKPLFDFLSAKPTRPRFSPLHYPKKLMTENLERVNKEDGAELRNRNGILLSNTEMVAEKLNTLTPVLWSLYNQIGERTVQKPHRHNSIAVDLCIGLHPESTGLVYTLMGPELDENGNVKDPIRMNWKENTVFTTPPGWWHSHHNDSEHSAMVFPIQDAGLHTYMNTLDIQFT